MFIFILVYIFFVFVELSLKMTWCGSKRLIKFLTY